MKIIELESKIEKLNKILEIKSDDTDKVKIQPPTYHVISDRLKDDLIEEDEVNEHRESYASIASRQTSE